MENIKKRFELVSKAKGRDRLPKPVDLYGPIHLADRDGTLCKQELIDDKWTVLTSSYGLDEGDLGYRESYLAHFGPEWTEPTCKECIKKYKSS
jgi:hypothetical protein